jgi:hypothetical protein
MMHWICYGVKWLCAVLMCSSICLWGQENDERPFMMAGFWAEFNTET